MIQNRFGVVATIVFAALGGLVLPGCETSTERARSSARGAAGYFLESLEDAPAQIDATTAALTKATAGDVSDRKAAVKDFTRELNELETHALSVARARDNAENRTQEYFREWLKESRTIKSESERNDAIKRLDAGQANVSQALEYLRLGARDFRALNDEMLAAGKSLSADMSAANVEKVRQSLAPVYDNATMVKAYIARLEDQITSTLARK